MGNDRNTLLVPHIKSCPDYKSNQMQQPKDWTVVSQSDSHTLPVIEQSRLQVSHNTLLSAPHQQQTLCVCVCLCVEMFTWLWWVLCARPWPGFAEHINDRLGDEWDRKCQFHFGMHNSITLTMQACGQSCEAHTETLTGFPSACIYAPLRFVRFTIFDLKSLWQQSCSTLEKQKRTQGA